MVAAFEAIPGNAEVVFVDDVPENVDGARACGWHAVLHETPRWVIRQGAGWSVRRFGGSASPSSCE